MFVTIPCVLPLIAVRRWSQLARIFRRYNVCRVLPLIAVRRWSLAIAKNKNTSDANCVLPLIAVRRWSQDKLEVDGDKATSVLPLIAVRRWSRNMGNYNPCYCWLCSTFDRRKALITLAIPQPITVEVRVLPLIAVRRWSLIFLTLGAKG